MDVETLALLKLIIVAGLAYLTLRKTRQIHETHQIVRAIRKQCKIEDITMRNEPIVQQEAKTLEQENNKIVSYEEFMMYHQRIGREQGLKQQQSDSEQIEIFSCEGCDLNERFSTAPSDDKKETLSLKSSRVLELDDRESANKLYWEATNLNKRKLITTPLHFQKIPKTSPRVLKTKKLFAKNKNIKKSSFYKKSKRQQART